MRLYVDSALNYLERLPVLPRLTGQEMAEEYRDQQECLSRYVGSLALVGGFGYSTHYEYVRPTVHKTVETLKERGLCEDKVGLRIITPKALEFTVANRNTMNGLRKSAGILIGVIEKTSNAAVHYESSPLKIGADGNGAPEQAFAGLDRALREFREESGEGGSFIGVIDARFAVRAFRLYRSSNILDGRIAVLSEVGGTPKDNKWACHSPRSVIRKYLEVP